MAWALWTFLCKKNNSQHKLRSLCYKSYSAAAESKSGLVPFVMLFSPPMRIVVLLHSNLALHASGTFSGHHQPVKHHTNTHMTVAVDASQCADCSCSVIKLCISDCMFAYIFFAFSFSRGLFATKLLLPPHPPCLQVVCFWLLWLLTFYGCFHYWYCHYITYLGIFDKCSVYYCHHDCSYRYHQCHLTVLFSIPKHPF